MRLTSFETAAIEISSEGTVEAVVRLDAAAPAGGVPVLLGSSDAEVKVPSRIVIPPGQTSGTFTIGAGTLRALQPYHVWAQVRETVLRQRLYRRESGLLAFAFAPGQVEGGQSSTLTATLDAPAPSGGALVVVDEVLGYAGDALPLLVDLPASMFVAEGDTYVSVSVTSRDWSHNGLPPPCQIAAAVDGLYGGVTHRAILVVTDPC